MIMTPCPAPDAPNPPHLRPNPSPGRYYNYYVLYYCYYYYCYYCYCYCCKNYNYYRYYFCHCYRPQTDPPGQVPLTGALVPATRRIGSR